LATLLTPPQDNNGTSININENANINVNSHNNPHSLFFSPHNDHNDLYNTNSNNVPFDHNNKNADNTFINNYSTSSATLSTNEDLKLCVVQDNSTLCDEAVVLPNQILIKTWRVKNIGNREIKDGLYIKYVGNVFNPMVNGAQFPITINNDAHVLSINEEMDVSVTIESPIQNGRYSSEWNIFNSDGKSFDLILMININVSSENDQNEKQSNTIHENIALDNSNNDKNGDNINSDHHDHNDDNHSETKLNNNKNEIESGTENKNDKEKEKEKEKNEKEQSNTQPENNNDPYGPQIQLLLEMGFTNVDMLRSLLASHNGLVDVVVNLLS